MAQRARFHARMNTRIVLWLGLGLAVAACIDESPRTPVGGVTPERPGMMVPGFLPPPSNPENESGPSPSSGSAPKPETLSCDQILACVNKCNSDQACITGCIAGGTSTGRSRLDQLLACLTRNNCKDSSCVTAKCKPEFDICIGRTTPTGSDGGVAPDGGMKPDATVDGEPLEPNPFLGRIAGGSRIKPLYANTPEGGKFYTFYNWDTELKTRCVFTVAADDKIRCLPLPHLEVLNYFDETSCTNPLLPVDEACGMSYGIKRANGRTSVFKLGPPAMASAVYALHADAAGVERCVADTKGKTKSFYTLGAEVPPATFVAIDNGPRPHILPNRRIHPYVYTAADGLKERIDWWDSKLRQRCNIEVATDGERRCQPSTATAMPANRFFDASCTQLLAAINGANAPAMVHHVRAADTSMCPTRYTIHRAERVNPPMVYTRTATGCQGSAPSASTAYYVVREAILPSEYMKFTETQEGTGRLRQRVLTGEDGATDRLSRPFDSMYQDQCFFGAAWDGKYRCLPFVNRRETFGDAMCTKPVSESAGSLCKVSGVISFQNERWCVPATRVFSVGAAVTPVYRQNEAGMCVPVNRGGQRELGAEVPPTGFVEVKEMFE
jgi:hypothetical protein